MKSAISPIQKKPVGLCSTMLKWFACVSMLLDHIGACCLEGGALASVENLPSPLSFASPQTAQVLAELAPSLRNFYYLDVVLRLAGRLAFPIYCFLLVEGFLHTRSVRKYLLRLGLFALISEIPFDLAFFQSPVAVQHQNVYFTLFFGLLALAGLKGCSAKPGVLWAFARVGVVLGCCAAAFFLFTDYDAIGVLLIVVLYQTRNRPILRLIGGAAMLYWEFPAPLAFLPIYFYNGQRGRCPRWLQMGFYWFYPVHLLLLAGIARLLFPL